MTATTSVRSLESPVFCISTVTAIRPIVQRANRSTVEDETGYFRHEALMDLRLLGVGPFVVLAVIDLLLVSRERHRGNTDRIQPIQKRARDKRQRLPRQTHSLGWTLPLLCSLSEMFKFSETRPTLRNMLHEQSVFCRVKAAWRGCCFLQKRTVWTAIPIWVRIILLNNALDRWVQLLEWIFLGCHVLPPAWEALLVVQRDDAYVYMYTAQPRGHCHCNVKFLPTNQTRCPWEGSAYHPEQCDQWSLRRARTVEELERLKHLCRQMGTLKRFLTNGGDFFNWPKLDVHEIRRRHCDNPSQPDETGPLSFSKPNRAKGYEHSRMRKESKCS
jgi:hypothetical protein